MLSLATVRIGLYIKPGILYGKLHSGEVHDQMCNSRKVCKVKLKWCQDQQNQIKMDIYQIQLVVTNPQTLKGFRKIQICLTPGRVSQSVYAGNMNLQS